MGRLRDLVEEFAIHAVSTAEHLHNTIKEFRAAVRLLDSVESELANELRGLLG